MENIFKDKDVYLNLCRKYQGLFEIKVKFPVVDKKSLALVYTPGVAASCLEINKNIDDSYKYTNKLNSMLIITDSSAGNFKNEKWNDFAPIPYLEGISILYKKLANIDCYPLIIKKDEIKSEEEFEELITRIMLCFSAIEFYNISEETIKQFSLIREKKLKESSNFLENTELSHHFATVSSINKHEISCPININFIYSAALRASLDTQAYVNLNDLISKLIQYSEKIEKRGIYATMTILLEFAFNYINNAGLINSKSGSYFLNPIIVNK